ncbi:aminoglycoside phosphotransferase family protein [Bacillus sp. 31A1R]|uniref:Aminoglycoside phosphotransferase family protein n=1 Tax=Robertmurraya mangrovi TaxID=3098077 RepID=A0ABU5IW68_9BACI|nr:aminoglycoside phosphotransferase family protein [Bacillus sp. 31A1R]MDZ5471408.1 aminoglycoside phosphotransferase family protein [Bacillus sp. 31A1R]
MTELENRLKEFRWKLLRKEIINGLHAGNIIRISVMDENNHVRKFIYKEFSTGRKNEIEIYSKLLPILSSFVPVIKLWNMEPEAILMEDLGTSLKKNFHQSTMEDKKITLLNILYTLSDLHSTHQDLSTTTLPKHQMTTEWYDWCCMQLDKLSSLHLDWFQYEWEGVMKSASKLIYSNYEVKCPAVLTHGDPHLDNVFIKNDQSVCLIDWEWAALGSPLRDMTILLQDIYDIHLIRFVKEYYYKLLTEKGIHIEKENYLDDFNYLYMDHTFMMLAWEVEKHFKGFVSEKEIKHIIEFKIGQIQNTVQDIFSY